MAAMKKGRRSSVPRKRSAKPARPSRRPKTRAQRTAPRLRTPKARAVPGATKAAPPSHPPIPSGIGFLSQHLDYTSHAMDEVRQFYSEQLGFSASNFDPKIGYLFVPTGPSSSLGFMPPMPGPPEEWRPPREPAIYLMVADVDRAYHDLLARGVAFDQAPADMDWGHRIALLRDPEGRRVCLAQEIKR